MKVALVYDEPPVATVEGHLPEDFGAEYEEAIAIDGLFQALVANHRQSIRIPFNEDFFARIRSAGPDIVFNIAEGARGPTRESIVPAWLDHLQIPYTGSDGLTLAATLDKALTKHIVSSLGIATPRYRRIGSISELEEIGIGFPMFVKPNAEGSSMGIRHASRVTSPTELRRQVEWVLREYSQDCLVEEFAPGPEFCVAILGNEDPQALPIAEIRAPSDFYSYEEKSRHIKEVVCPATLPDEAGVRMSEAGLEIYRALRCRDLARLDFRIDVTGQPAFLEINPLPGLAREYGIFPAQAAAAGLAYDDLIERIIQLALARGEQHGGGTA